jgi:hypothetical protein
VFTVHELYTLDTLCNIWTSLLAALRSVLDIRSSSVRELFLYNILFNFTQKKIFDNVNDVLGVTIWQL